MTKTELPPRGSWNRILAESIWKHIQPGNPHGPQSDLYFEMPYVRDSAERATRIANELIEEGWRPPVNWDLPITVEKLAQAGGPTIVEPTKGVVSLVSGLGNETVDMTIEQALDLRLMLSIKGHQSNLYLATGEELWLACTCGKFDVHVGAQQGDLEAVCADFVAHLKQILSLPKLKDLPDGTYYDGTYEWEKDGKDWTPLRAPRGMPPTPEIARLKRVRKSYEDLDA